MSFERASQKGPSRVPKSCVLLNLLDPKPAACQLATLWLTAGPYEPPVATDRSIKSSRIHCFMRRSREELLSPPARVRVAARLASRTYRNLPIKENFPPWRGTQVQVRTHLDTGGVPTSAYGPRQQDKPFLETEFSFKNGETRKTYPLSPGPTVRQSDPTVADSSRQSDSPTVRQSDSPTVMSDSADSYLGRVGDCALSDKV